MPHDCLVCQVYNPPILELTLGHEAFRLSSEARLGKATLNEIGSTDFHVMPAPVRAVLIDKLASARTFDSANSASNALVSYVVNLTTDEAVRVLVTEAQNGQVAGAFDFAPLKRKILQVHAGDRAFQEACAEAGIALELSEELLIEN